MKNNELRFAWKLAFVLCFIGAVFAFSMAAFVEGIEPNKGDVELVGVYGVTNEFQEEVGAEWVPIAVNNSGGMTWRIPVTCDVAPVRIIDGDTFKAATVTSISPTIEVTELTGFRLLGVDTPERREEGYQEAKDYLQKMIGGKLIHVSFKSGHGKKRDSFGRFLVDVVLCTKDSYVDINREIIKKGLGKEYPR